MDASGPLAIPRFDGTTSFAQWLKEFNEQCTARDWDAAQRSTRLPLFFTGKARFIYEQLALPPTASYEDKCQAFQARQDPEPPLVIRQSGSLNPTRQPTESIHDYAFRLTTAFTKAFPGLPPEVISSWVNAHVFNGLEPRLQHNAVLSKATDLDTLLQLVELDDQLHKWKPLTSPAVANTVQPDSCHAPLDNSYAPRTDREAGGHSNDGNHTPSPGINRDKRSPRSESRPNSRVSFQTPTHSGSPHSSA